MDTNSHVSVFELRDQGDTLYSLAEEKVQVVFQIHKLRSNKSNIYSDFCTHTHKETRTWETTQTFW